MLETHLRELLIRRIEGATVESEIRWHQGSPFRSLQSFELEHAPVFFGRTRARNELRELLSQGIDRGCAFVLVLGASGSGKSSLVKAGLLPDLLLPGMIGKVALCRYALFRPGDRPGDLISGLAAAIVGRTALPELTGLQYDEATLATLLRGSSSQAALPLRQGLAKAAETARLTEVAGSRLLLTIDQLEELFTQDGVTPADREAFIGALATLARSGQVWIVATMRSDFFDRLERSPALAALSAGARYLLSPPDDAEIGQIVRQPAREAGLRFEIDTQRGLGLDAAIQEAATRHPASLPLLEFMLDQLWQRRTAEGEVTFAAYEQLGGLEGALGGRAEEEFAKLPMEVQAALPGVLRALVTVGQGARGAVTSRPASLTRFIAGSPQRQLVDAFLGPQARLFVAEGDGEGARVRIAHEALLTHWERAMKQVAADRADLQLRARLEQAAAIWRATEPKARDGRLLSVGLPLSEAEDLLARRHDELEEELLQYVSRSTQVAHMRERRRLWWLGTLTGVFALLAILAGIGGWFAYEGQKLAEGQLRAAQITQSRFLADLSQQHTAKGDPATGIVLALEALPERVDEPGARPVVVEG
jgi:hypothetical protein